MRSHKPAAATAAVVIIVVVVFMISLVWRFSFADNGLIFAHILFSYICSHRLVFDAGLLIYLPGITNPLSSISSLLYIYICVSVRVNSSIIQFLCTTPAVN